MKHISHCQDHGVFGNRHKFPT